MKYERLKELENGDATEIELLKFIPNHLGINLCAVDDIIVKKQADEQLISIHIDFIPDNK